MRFGVVIPTFNEAEFIGPTIASLAQQVTSTGQPLRPDELEVVVVDTPGSDGTPEAARDAAARHGSVQVTVLSDPAPSMVSARITGMDYLLSRAGSDSLFLVSGDADTTFPSTWITSVKGILNQGFEMVSTAGCFENEMWLRCPRLTRRYVENIGTIFFTSDTAAEVVDPGERLLFTPRLFHDFGRPVSDCGFIISADQYCNLGGFRHEYYDDAETMPILAVGWPLMFRADLAGLPIAFMPTPEYQTSARRLLHEPEALFSGASYLGEIESFRSTSADQYAWLDHFAERLAMEPLRRYVIKNYLLQQCITRPDRVTRNPRYFGDVLGEVSQDIATWHKAFPDPVTRDIFAFADQLADRYFDQVMMCAASMATEETGP